MIFQDGVLKKLRDELPEKDFETLVSIILEVYESPDLEDGREGPETCPFLPPLSIECLVFGRNSNCPYLPEGDCLT